MRACSPITPALEPSVCIPVVTPVMAVGPMMMTVLIITVVGTVPSYNNPHTHLGVGMSSDNMRDRKG